MDVMRLAVLKRCFASRCLKPMNENNAKEKPPDIIRSQGLSVSKAIKTINTVRIEWLTDHCSKRYDIFKVSPSRWSAAL